MNEPEPLDIEKIKIKNNIHKLTKGQEFKSLKALFHTFDIDISGGGNRRKALRAKLSRYCNASKAKNSNKYTITKIFESPRPKINGKLLSSKLYPSCGYLLLKYLSYECNGDTIYFKKRKIIEICFLCNESFGDMRLIEEKSNKDSESKYIVKSLSDYLYKAIDRMLKSLKSNGFLTFNEVDMVVVKGSPSREANSKESKAISEYYKKIVKQYGLKNKNAIRFSKHKEEIRKEFETHFGFKYYTAIKFNLTDDLASNADDLSRTVGLNETCGLEVNSKLCADRHSKIFDEIIGIRKKEINTDYNFIYLNMDIRQELAKDIQEMQESGFSIPVEGVKPKYIKTWDFRLDDDGVKNRLDELIKLFIERTDDQLQEDGGYVEG